MYQIQSTSRRDCVGRLSIRGWSRSRVKYLNKYLFRPKLAGRMAAAAAAAGRSKSRSGRREKA